MTARRIALAAFLLLCLALGWTFTSHQVGARVAKLPLAITPATLTTGQSTPSPTSTPPATATAGATSTSTPTVTPTNTPVPPPSAKRLVALMIAAFSKAGSAHLEVTAKETATGKNAGKIELTERGDLGYRNPKSIKSHLFVSARITAANGVVLGLNTEYVIVGSRGAERQGKNEWKCMATKSLGVTGPGISSVPSVSSFGLSGYKFSRQGLSTVNGISVWQVRATGTTQIDSHTKGKTVLTLFIAQQNYRLVRLSGSVKGQSSGTKVVETLSYALSRYGQHAKIALPAACAKELTSRSSAALGTRRGRTLHDRQQMRFIGETVRVSMEPHT